MQIAIALDTLKKQGYKVFPTNSVMDLIMTRYESYLGWIPSKILRVVEDVYNCSDK